MRRPHPRVAALALAIGGIGTVVGGGGAAATPGAGPPAARHCLAPASALPEASGAVVSDLDPGVVFSHDDSGDTARFAAFDIPASGTTGCREVGSWSLPLPKPTDWEDAALGPGHTLVFGDIGDNGADRSSVQLVTVAEPRIGQPYVPHPSVRVLHYEDRAHDAEALLVQPRTGAAWVVTKSYAGAATVYAVRGNRLVAVTSLELGLLQPVTGGSVRRDGGAVVLRTYTDAWEWLVPRQSDRAFSTDLGAVLTGKPAAHLTLPAEPQGEGVSFTADGTGLVLTSETHGGPTWPIDVVALPVTLPSPPPTPSRPATAPPAVTAAAVPPAENRSAPIGLAAKVGIAAGAAVLLTAAVALWRRHS